MDDQARFAQRRDRFRSYEDPAAVTAYLDRLAREWPERAEIADHIVGQISQLATPQLHVLELCCGPGWLAQTMLDRLPAVQYTGVDLSPPFLAFAREQTMGHRERSTFHELDLSDEQWLAKLQEQVAGPFQAIVSMQSLHDVGDVSVIQQIYQQARRLLAPGGFLLNADLIVAEGHELSGNPGRLSIPHHLVLLATSGYERSRCTLAPGGFGCVIGWNSMP